MHGRRLAPIAELPCLLLSTRSAPPAGTAESTTTAPASAKSTAWTTSAGTAKTASAAGTAKTTRPSWSAKATSAGTVRTWPHSILRTTRKAHPESETGIGCRILLQALAQTSGDEKGLIAVLRAASRHSGSQRLVAVDFILQLGFELVPSLSVGSVRAHARQARGHGRFAQFQSKVRHPLFGVVDLLLHWFETEHLDFDRPDAIAERGKRVVTVFTGGGGEFFSILRSGNGSAGYGLIPRTDDAALGMKGSAARSGEQADEWP